LAHRLALQACGHFYVRVFDPETADDRWFGAVTAAEVWFGLETAPELWFGAVTAAEVWFGLETTPELWFGAVTAAEAREGRRNSREGRRDSREGRRNSREGQRKLSGRATNVVRLLNRSRQGRAIDRTCHVASMGSPAQTNRHPGNPLAPLNEGRALDGTCLVASMAGPIQTNGCEFRNCLYIQVLWVIHNVIPCS